MEAGPWLSVRLFITRVTEWCLRAEKFGLGRLCHSLRHRVVGVGFSHMLRHGTDGVLLCVALERTDGALYVDRYGSVCHR